MATSKKNANEHKESGDRNPGADKKKHPGSGQFGGVAIQGDRANLSARNEEAGMKQGTKEGRKNSSG